MRQRAETQTMPAKQGAPALRGALVSSQCKRDAGTLALAAISDISTSSQVKLPRVHPFPGSVRELPNVVGCAAIMRRGTRIDRDCLPPELLGSDLPSIRGSAPQSLLHELEAATIAPTPRQHGGNSEH
jgi:DNA-binding NtrC family response regulator